VDPIKAPDLAAPRFKANPYPFYARLRAEAPVYRVKLPFWGAVCLVTRYDDVLQVIKDERFANDWSPRMPWLLLRFARPLTRGMLNRDPPDHTRLRNLVQKAFTSRLVERLRERVQRVCDELLDAAAARGRMDVVGGFALPLPITIIGELLGVSEQDRLRFHAWSRSMIGVSRNTDAMRALPGIWALFRLLRRLFAQRRADPRDDLVTALVQAEESGDRLSEEELLSMVILLLIAGYETTTNLIGSGALALIQHPRQRDRWRQDPALAESGVEELLRFTSPLEIASVRLAREEVAFGSVTVRAGELVAGVLGSANRDERQFPDPDALDIARDPNRHLALGQGPHFCLGAPLARLEGRIALTTLLRRFPDLRLAQPAESLRWRKSPVLRGLQALPVTL
jgi:cytochrome P450 PksS